MLPLLTSQLGHKMKPPWALYHAISNHFNFEKSVNDLNDTYVFCALLKIVPLIWTVLRKDMNVLISPLRNIPTAKVRLCLKIHVAAGELLSCSDDQFLHLLHPSHNWWETFLSHLAWCISYWWDILDLPKKAVTQAFENDRPAAFSSFLPDLRRGGLTSNF